MKPSEEQRLGNVIVAALERVRRHVCQTGSAAQWHLAKAANLVRKPSLLERLVPHIEGEAAQEYLASLPARIEETKKQDSACGTMWSQRQAGDACDYHAERDRLVAILLKYDFPLRSYEKLARKPSTMLAEMATPPHAVPESSNGTHHDEASSRMTQQEFSAMEQQINEELKAVDEARAELVAAHDELVAKLAAKSKAPIEESTSYARCGLAKAAENFDVRRGFRFATYAQWWIKTAIKEKKTWDA